MIFPTLAALAAIAGTASAQSLTSLLSTNANLTGLNTLLAAYPEVVSTLGSATNITLLAPSNGALQAFMARANSTSPEAITALLQYHVLMGTHQKSEFGVNSTFLRSMLTNPVYANVTGGQRVEAVVSQGQLYFISGNIDNTTVAVPDIKFDGGVIHIIDRVLTIPGKLGARTISSAGVTVNALYTLLQMTNLLDTVSDLKDVTIFAPSDTGLTNVQSQLASLSPEQAANIARYHVVENGGPYYSPRFSANGNTILTAMSGQNITVTGRRVGGVQLFYANGARIVGSNWLVGGGVLHVIDNVLNPANSTTFITNPAIPSSSGDSDNGTSTSSGAGSTTSVRSAGVKNAVGGVIAVVAAAVGVLAL